MTAVVLRATCARMVKVEAARMARVAITIDSKRKYADGFFMFCPPDRMSRPALQLEGAGS
jgi:hypothetical protein